MTTRDNDDKAPPMAEPGSRPSGASTGGMASAAGPGLENATQRSFERGLEDATPGARSGEARAGGTVPRTDLGGTNEPGAGPGSRPGVDQPRAEAGRTADANRAAAGSAGTGGTGGSAGTGGTGGTGATGAAGAAAAGGHRDAAGVSGAGGSADRGATGAGASDAASTGGAASGRGGDLRGTPPRGAPAGEPTGAGEVEDLPEAPRDENAAESLGRAVSEVVTGVFDSPDHPRDKERR